MLTAQLAPLLGLLCGTWLPTGGGAPQTREPPATLQTLKTGSRALSAESSWASFLNRQKEEATALALPLSPKEATWGSCKAVPFTQVLSRPGCSAIRLQNLLCFGRCSSLYIPGSRPGPCSACAPTRQRRTPVFLRCRGPGTPGRRVKMAALVVEECACTLGA